MNKDEISKQINELFTAIGAMVEMWNVTFKEFKKIGYSDKDAIEHTREFMKIIIHKPNGEGGQG